MAKKNNILYQLNDIEEDINNISKYIAKQTAIVASNDLYDAKEQIVSEFYKYERKSNGKRRNNLQDAIKITSPIGKDKKWNASIIIDGSAMGNDYGSAKKKISGSSVLDLIWNEGVRGLPEKGTKPLSHSYNWNGIEFEEGEIWENPYWDPEEYHNIFKLKIHIGSFVSDENTPDIIINQLINNWGKERAEEVFDDVVNKIIGKFNQDYSF